MFDFFIKKYVVANTQKYINKLNPAVSLHVPHDLPLPSVSTIKRMGKIVSRINGLEPAMSRLSDQQLKDKTDEFRKSFQQAIKAEKQQYEQAQHSRYQALSHEEREQAGVEAGRIKEEFDKVRQKALDQILPEAFAVVREVGKRLMNMRHFDVQLVGGMILHQGKIAEMATGEGKTLVATLPAYLNALTGEGVHIVTVNDYLAKRDCEWMGPIYEFLGLSVGVILHDMNPSQRQQAYGCDITYGTNNEFGFDYLRDNMVTSREDMVQRPHHFAIVDEVDSILIDEARTPLIISGPAEESTDKYYRANDVSRRLKGVRITEDQLIEAKHRGEDAAQLSQGYDYVADEKTRSVSLTDQGEMRASQEFGIDNLHDMDTIEYRHHILQALKAKEFFKNDVDYVIRDGQVIIVDEFTGRMMPGRRWSDGLHQAVEAKEGIKIERENQTLATITFQNYFRMYDKLSGMTGTAYTEATEFQQIYSLDSVVLPTNRILQRTNHADCIYKTIAEKYKAVVEEIKACYEKGQPVLVGTISIEKSEYLSSLLQKQGIPHEVLNAKYHEREAHIVAQAGRYKAVTIATNMAGRGTDIVLGGNAAFLAKSMAAQKFQNGEEDQDQDALTKKFLEQFRQQVKQEHEQVILAGGLHVLGTERHEARRIDNQLRGRSGRQGDPGSSRFFVALEDDLMRLFAMDRIMGMMDRLGMEEGQAIEHPWVSKAIEVAQKRVETQNFEIRKQLLEFDNVMNKQREAVYGLRRMILESQSIKDRIQEAIEDTADLVTEQFLFSGTEEVSWDVDGLIVYLQSKFNYDFTPHKEDIRNKNRNQISDMIAEGLLQAYETREEEISAQDMRHLEKFVMLNTIDAKWKDHLYAMDQLKEGVGLRSYAQRDPIVEYKREGFMMFQMMYDSINQEVIEMLFKVRPVTGQERMRSVFDSVPQEFVHNEFSSMERQAALAEAAKARAQQQQALGQPPQASAPPEPKAKPITKAGPKVGRNDPCPCGSGKKYKKCCGR